MSEHNDRYGINMKKYCREHEAAMRRALDEINLSDSDTKSESLQHIAGSTGYTPLIAGVDSGHSTHDPKAAFLHSLNSSELLEYHLEKTRWIQHERLIHLIVTVMVVFIELFVVYLTVLHPELGILPPIIMLGLAILLGFYFYHYFFLENTIQRWYKIADELYDTLRQFKH
jgi:hypothetical protein